MGAKLKPVTFWNAISFRIPEQWQCIREPEGHWGCYDTDNDTGTVWVDFDMFRAPEGEQPSPINLFETAISEGMATSIEFPDGRRAVNVVKRGYDHGSPEELLFSHWHHLGTSGPYFGVVHLTFVTPVELLTGPNYQVGCEER
jgi:hypothetical protein